MALNSHFKNFILPSLLNSPAWVWVFNSFLRLLGKHKIKQGDGTYKKFKGYSFLYRFPLFLGYDPQTAELVEELPSPAGEFGFNPVWLDFKEVKRLLDTQGFSADFKSSLEMLPTGLGRLNCTSPYMFFKVLNAIGVPRSRFTFLGSTFATLSNTRRIDYFLELTGDLGGGTYAYRSLSPLRDGDVLMAVGSDVPIVIDSYSTEMLSTESGLLLGFYSIFRHDSLFPVVEEGVSLYLWSYSNVPSQLVYDRYCPIHVYGSALQQMSLPSLSIRCIVSDITLQQRFWLILRSVLDSAFDSGAVTNVVLDSIAIPSIEYKFDMSDWDKVDNSYGKVLEFVVLSKWVSRPTQSYFINAWLLDVADFSYLFDKETEDLIIYTEALDSSADLPVYTEDDRVLALNISTYTMGEVGNAEVVCLFDTTQNYEFGFLSMFNTIFRWRPAIQTASFSGQSYVGSLPRYSSLRILIDNSIVYVYINGQLRFTRVMNATDLFSGWTSGRVYLVRKGNDLAYATKDGVVFQNILDETLSFYDTVIPMVKLEASSYVKPSTTQVCGTSYSQILYDYKVPFYAWDDIVVSWGVDMSFTWRVNLNNL